MDFASRMAHLWAIGVLVAQSWNMAAVGAISIPLKYCANINTGSSTAGNQSIYQSDGLCHDFCHDRSKSFAILQDKTCWCSNNAPDQSAQQDLSSCSQACPGFPDDICGGSGGLFVYLDSGGSGQGGGGAAQSTGQSTMTTPSTPSVETVTESGTVRTVTVTPTPGVPSSSEQGTISSQGGGLGTGAAVGIAVGIIAILVAAGILAFCMWRRKKNRQAAAMFGSPSPRGSSSGMMSSTKAAEAGATPPYIGRPTEGSWETDGSTKRRSTLMPIDPRIDPAHSGIYNRHENISHDSINTLRDDQDYSRRVHQPTKVLRATNPDPDMGD